MAVVKKRGDCKKKTKKIRHVENGWLRRPTVKDGVCDKIFLKDETVTFPFFLTHLLFVVSSGPAAVLPPAWRNVAKVGGAHGHGEVELQEKPGGGA